MKRMKKAKSLDRENINKAIKGIEVIAVPTVLESDINKINSFRNLSDI